ncbi:MAG: DUF4157 domain-containing protein [Acidobacteria bacterium]|nr:DUF4157 domain-containing protein [Acidobacteriota bacterium]
MREANKAPSKPPPKPPLVTRIERPSAPVAPLADRLFLGGSAAAAEQQAAAAGEAVPRGGLPWLGGAPVASTVGPQFDHDATSPREQAPYGVIIEDGLPLGPGQIHRTDFVESMARDISALADEELAAVNRTAADCAFLAHWLTYYRSKPAALIERTIRMFATPTRTDLDGLREALLTRVREAARQWIMLGMPGADSTALFPPGSAAPDASTGESGESLARKAESPAAAPAPPGSAAAVRTQLGSGQPLDMGVRTRMERGFGTSFADVRVHTGPDAARISSQYSARAFAVGTDVGFAPGRFQPGSLRGDALIAHELAHVVQQRGAQYDAGTSRSAGLEQDADRAAIDLLTSERTATPQGRSGTRLQLDDCCEQPEHQDWRGRNATEYAVAAAQIQLLRDEQQRLLVQPGLDPARDARLAEIQSQMQLLAAAIQQMGVQRTTSQILTGVIGGEDLRTVSVTEVTGGDPATLYWGEQRTFQVALGYLPTDTEVHVIWWYSSDDTKPPLQDKDYRQGGNILQLAGEFWGDFSQEQAAAAARGNPVPTTFRLHADIMVAGEYPPATTGLSPVLTVEQRIPDQVSIQIPSIDQRAPAAPAAPVSPGTTTAPPASGAPPAGPSTGGSTTASPTVPPALAALVAGPNSTSAGPDSILEGARIHYRLSWLAPILYGQNPRYAIFWRVDRVEAGVHTTVQSFGPGELWGITGPLSGPGSYEVRADVVTRPQYDRANQVGTTAIVTARRQLRVLSDTDVGSQSIATYSSSGGPPTSAAFVADLDRQIASLRRTLATGSVTPGALESQISQLTQMRTRLVNQLGAGNAQPFPANGAFDESTIYTAPLTAVMVHPSHAGAVPMSVYLRVWHDGNWRCRVIDTTTADVIAVEGSSGGVAGAVQNAINALQSQNEYPQEGQFYYSFNGGGISLTGHFSTSRWTKTFTEWFDRILFVVGAIVGVVLLLTPEPSGLTKAAGFALLAVSVLRSAYAIYNNLSLGRPLLDQRNILEALSIISAFLGVRGSQIMGRAAQAEVMTARAISSFRLGRGMVIASFATDAGSFVWASHDAIRQMEAAAYSTGDDAQRQSEFNSTIMRLAVQGLLLVGNAHQLFHPVAGTRRSVSEAMIPEGGIQLDPAQRSRIEVELRRMGFQDETTRMTDADLVRQFAELHFSAARTEAAATAAPTGGATRGRATYDVQPAPHFDAAEVRTAMSSPFRNRGHAGLRIENARLTTRGAETVVTTTGTVAVAGRPTPVPCKIEVTVVPDIGALGAGPHGGESGWGRVSVSKNAAGEWVMAIAIDGRLGGADPRSDIRGVLGHEVDEGARIIAAVEADPTTNIAAEHEARVFHPGGDPAARLSGHDFAAVHELRRMFTEVGGWVDRFRISTDAMRNQGTAIPPDVLRIQERVNSMLDTMGFRDPATRDSRLAALQTQLGADMPVGLADYIRGRYAQRVTAETRIDAAFGSTPTALTTDLVIHLTSPEPGGGPSAFAASGISGGHDQNGLYIFVNATTSPAPTGGTVQRYQVSLVKQATVAGIGCRIHIQWERSPGATAAVPARDMTASGSTAASFDAARAAHPAPAGWNQSGAPKTTVDRPHLFLLEIDQAFNTWSGSTAASGVSGNVVVFGTVPGATHPSLVSANGLAIGGRAVRSGGVWRITAAWLELSNFGW